VNSATGAAKRLVGYCDELRVCAGGHVAFHVSGDVGNEYSLTVHRLLGGGSDPAGPPLRTESVTAEQRCPVLEQPIVLGSFGQAALSPAAAQAFCGGCTAVVRVQPTATGVQQTILQLVGADGGLEVGLTDDGRAVLTVGGQRLVGARVPTSRVDWTDLVATWNDEVLVLAVGSGQGWDVVEAPAEGSGPTAVREVLVGAGRDGGSCVRHFSGRLERPAVLVGALQPGAAVAQVGIPGSPVPTGALVLWDFSERIGTWSVPGHGVFGAQLTFRGAPKRAAAGSSWTGAVDWQQAPDQFGAVHFYPDSLEDCGWVSQVGWTVPPETRSGFYAAHVVSGVHEDWIPFFVRPSAGSPTADLVVVASSATYFAYANSRFWWEDPIQEIAQDRLVELGPEEQYLVAHPELGLSNYDLHRDGSAVIFSSRRRPNLFMRPGHSRGESYASDLYLIAWLEHLGVPYDVVTDEDLHIEGRALLDGYRVAISGSHPEYISIPMFDAVQGWVDEGGRYLYLGGNGFTSCVTWGTERPWLMENRATGRMRVDDARTRAEAVNQLDGLLGSQMAESGRSPGSLWGVDSVTMGFDRSYPVLRSDASYAPEFAFAFVGIDRRLFGGRSLSGGGVIGQEWDNARLVAGTPGHYVLASSIDHSLIPDVLGADPVHHGDVVLFFHDRGVVLSASAMAWTGALHVDHYENDAETFMRNVLTRFLDPAPLPQPANK
jgi:N,N-dimethylformamidase